MRRILLLAILAGAAFASIGQSGGDSFETALEAGEGTFPIGGAAGSSHYFFSNITAGTALAVEKPCENSSISLPIYEENLQLAAAGINGTSRWSASSQNLTYKTYFVAMLCGELDWIQLRIENRQDLSSGTDAGKDFEGALAASGGTYYNCCHLSLNNGIEGGNDNEDMYLLSTIAGNTVTVDTRAPLELAAYTKEGAEMGRATGKLSFVPGADSSYFMVRTTPEFSAGTNSNYSLLIEGAGPATVTGTGPAQQQQQAPVGEKNGTRRDAKRANATSGPANYSLGEDKPSQEEKPAKKGALEAISDQISGTIKLAEQNYGLANTSGGVTEKPQGENSTTKKGITILIAAGAIAIIIRTRKSS